MSRQRESVREDRPECAFQEERSYNVAKLGRAQKQLGRLLRGKMV